jgi:hypothetical protein
MNGQLNVTGVTQSVQYRYRYCLQGLPGTIPTSYGVDLFVPAGVYVLRAEFGGGK